jgi:hypothetical protein
MSGRREKFVVDFECVATETDKLYGFDAAGAYKLTNSFNCNTRSAVRWKGIDAGADGGERDGSNAVLFSQFETAPVAAGEKIVLVAIAPVPDGTDGVEHPPGGKPEAGGRFRVAGGAAVKFAAGFQKVRAGGSMDCAVDTTTAQQSGIGSVDDCIDFFRRDVTLNCDEIGHVESPV